ncbi:MAG: DUF1282 family protein [Chitinimonas sp.]|nr:DUF1282 family protein [Chitinimonas sp.]
MKISAYPKMLLSYDAGWQEFQQAAPSIIKVYLLLVVPLSLLPALMIAFVASDNAAYYSATLPASHYGEIAGLFLVTELLSVPVMAMTIRSVVTLKVRQVNFRQCFLLAALAPIPMWLSSLSLLVPHVGFSLACGFMGLLASGALLVHGIPALLGVERGIDAEDVTYVVLSLGAIMWALMTALIIVPLLGS